MHHEYHYFLVYIYRSYLCPESLVIGIVFVISNVNSLLQFIGATMGSAELNIQTEHGHIGMPSTICCVVVEYLPGGALKSYLIKNHRRKLAFKVVVQLALDLARGSNSFAPSVSYFILQNLSNVTYFLLTVSEVWHVNDVLTCKISKLFFGIQSLRYSSVCFLGWAIFILRRLSTEMWKQRTCFWTRLVL